MSLMCSGRGEGFVIAKSFTMWPRRVDSNLHTGTIGGKVRRDMQRNWKNYAIAVWRLHTLA